MKKLLCGMLALVLMAGLFTSCKKSEKDDPSEANKSSTSSTEEGEVEPTEIVVYSVLADDLTKAAADGFEEKTGISVRIISDSAARLLERIGTSTGAQADVLLGAGAEVVVQCANLFEPYITAEAGAIDERFTAADGLYTGITLMPIVIMYNKDMTTKAPAGWSTLAASAYKGGVAFANPENSGTSYTALCSMALTAGKDGTPDYAFIEKFAANLDGEMMDSMSDVYAAVASGEFASGVTLESSVHKYLNAGYEEIVGIAYPTEGTPIALEVAALVKGASNPKDAKLFLDYITSAEFQMILMENFGRRTVRTDSVDPRFAVEKSEITFSPLTAAQAITMREELLPHFATGTGSVQATNESSASAAS